MRTSADYRCRMESLQPNVYIDGELVSRNDDRLQPGINVLALSFDLTADERKERVFTAQSHLSGDVINRFCHIHQSADDLLRKQAMTRLACHRTGGCIQRCMGIDALNALSVATYNIDSAHSTDYHQSFLEYLRFFQDQDLTACCAQTDVKGDRSQRPHRQQDPDLYVRIVDRRQEGIIVKGAKAHITMAPYADEIIVIPTRRLTKDEEDWAVAFAVPADTPGVKMVTRPASFRPRQQLQAPIASFGVAESLIIFDEVFVPRERVFMDGEWEFGGRLAMLFATFHRHSYTGCKPATSDILMGMSALVAEYSGLEKAKHVQSKIADLIGVAELTFAAGIAAAVNALPAESGTMVPNAVYANVGRRHAGESIFHEYEIMADISGGLPATLPLEGDYLNQEIGPLVSKYLMRNPGVTPEDQYRCFRLIGDLICSSMAGWGQLAGLHGGGSPIMETIGLLAQYDLDTKKEIAKRLAGITS